MAPGSSQGELARFHVMQRPHLARFLVMQCVRITGHGLRSTASTPLNEQGWHPDATERQLAHSERNEIRAAYNYAKHLPERRKMMQAWSDYLAGLRRVET